MNLFNFNKTYIGIDIGTKHIKGIKIVKGFSGFKAIAMAKVMVPSGGIKQGLFYDSSLAINLLRDVVSKLKVGNQGICLGFSGQHAFIREIELPIMSDSELKEAIYWEAGKVLPYAIDEAIIDWVVLDKNKESSQMMSILLVAGRKDYIYSFLKPFTTIGLKVLNLSIYPIPLINILKLKTDEIKKDTIAVIDIGADATHMLIIKSGLPYLSRTIPIGGFDFTEVIAQSLAIPVEEAEEIKLKFGSLSKKADSPYPGLEEVLETVAQDVIGEIKRSTIHFHLHNRGQQINKIYITGGSSCLPGMVQYLTDHLNIPVSPLDLTDLLICDDDKKRILKDEGAFFTEAFGLALSEV